MIEHASSATRQASRSILEQQRASKWKAPGEELFKFDYVRVLLETEMPSHLKTTALYLASSFWSRGDVGIAYETLAHQLGVNERTVKNNVKVLVDLGWITRESGRRHKVNQYQGHIPDYLPEVRAAMARIEERQRLQDARKNSNASPDLVIKFISRLYADKHLDHHLQEDLPEKAMKTLRRTVKQLLDSTAPDHELAHEVIASLSTWPLPEKITCRPLMFDGAIHHLVPSLRLNQSAYSLRFVDTTHAWPAEYIEEDEPF
jgi:DNA-binding MarR family transcriptional regulator